MPSAARPGSIGVHSGPGAPCFNARLGARRGGTPRPVSQPPATARGDGCVRCEPNQGDLCAHLPRPARPPPKAGTRSRQPTQRRVARQVERGSATGPREATGGAEPRPAKPRRAPATQLRGRLAGVASERVVGRLWPGTLSSRSAWRARNERPAVAPAPQSRCSSATSGSIPHGATRRELRDPPGRDVRLGQEAGVGFVRLSHELRAVSRGADVHADGAALADALSHAAHPGPDRRGVPRLRSRCASATDSAVVSTSADTIGSRMARKGARPWDADTCAQDDAAGPCRSLSIDLDSPGIPWVGLLLSASIPGRPWSFAPGCGGGRCARGESGGGGAPRAAATSARGAGRRAVGRYEERRRRASARPSPSVTDSASAPCSVPTPRAAPH